MLDLPNQITTTNMAAQFTWTTQYSVNVEELDEQHKVFISICNELLELSAKPTITKDEAFKEISRLGDYAFMHLDTEEEYFTKTKYPDAAMHIFAHDAFRSRTNKLINQMRNADSGFGEIAGEAANFAANWLLQHIIEVDKQYSAYMNENGIK